MLAWSMLRRSVSLMLLLLALGVTGSTAAAADSSAAALPALVREYVETHQAERAEQILTEILARPDATIPAVSAALSAGPSYRNEPKGLQPGETIQVGSHAFSYGLYVPDSYSPDKSLGLVICLHGAGFTGDSYLERWQTRLGDGYILACPTVPMGSWWTRTAEQLVLATIRAVESRYRIDPDRVYLTGMSNGGIGAYLIGAHHAPLFAAVVPMAGGLPEVLLPFLENFRQTPVYIIHGTQDQVMPVTMSRSIDEALTELGYRHVYREHDRVHPHAGGHFFPREELPDLVTWLGSQRRNPLPQKLTVVQDASHLSVFAWVRIDATDRIAEFSDNLIDAHDELIMSRQYAKLDAVVAGPNRIEVRTKHVRRYSVFLNDALVDLSRPVTIVTNGTISFDGPVTASVKTLLHDARVRQDPRLLFPAIVSVNVPAKE